MPRPICARQLQHHNRLVHHGRKSAKLHSPKTITVWFCALLMVLTACTAQEEEPEDPAPQSDVEPQPPGNNGNGSDNGQPEDTTDQDDAPDEEEPDQDSGPDSEEPDPDVPDEDEEEWEDDNCHTDCFGGAKCVDGQIEVFAVGALPCHLGLSCPSSPVYTCEQGCRQDLTYLDDPDAAATALCEENRPIEADEPCNTDADCQPVQVRTVEDSTFIEVDWLICGPNSTCQPDPEPQTHNHMDPCGLTLDSPELDSSPFGLAHTVPSPTCTSGLCAVQRTGGCLIQGCTLECLYDHDCPEDNRCKRNPEDPSDFESRGHCQPPERVWRSRPTLCQ